MSTEAREPSFEEALKALEEIVRKLESGEAPLDESIALYEQGHKLRALQGRLQLGGNSLRLNGSYGKPGDRLQLLLDAPQLGLLGPAFSGRVRGELDLGGVPGISAGPSCPWWPSTAPNNTGWYCTL